LFENSCQVVNENTLCSRLHLEFAKGACWHQTISPRNVNWLLERTVDTGINGVSFGPHSLSDLDFADDVALLAKLLELLVPALETMAPKATSLGLELN